MNIIPKDLSRVVRDIKLAILQTRARAAHASNAEALKLYFFVGGYISQKTRAAKWGSGAINALSERLQIELPGLRGFSPSSIKFMRLWYEAWSDCFSIRYLSSNELAKGNESRDDQTNPICLLKPNRYLVSNELDNEVVSAFMSIGFTHHREIIRFCKNRDERWYYILACARGMWSVEALCSHLRADDYRHIGALLIILQRHFHRCLLPLQRCAHSKTNIF